MMADVKRQQADLTAQAKVLREQAKALRPAKITKTLEEVTHEQDTVPRWAIGYVVKRVQARVRTGEQDVDEAMRDVLGRLDTLARAEMASRVLRTAAKKDATAE
jgi:hypothetical protein